MSTKAIFGAIWRVNTNSGKMDSENELRELQREYLDFIDDEVSPFKLLKVFNVICNDFVGY